MIPPSFIHPDGLRFLLAYLLSARWKFWRDRIKTQGDGNRESIRGDSCARKQNSRYFIREGGQTPLILYALEGIIEHVRWVVEIGEEFEPEFYALHEEVREAILALARLLQQFGPQLGRPHVDTLNGSRHKNMKELRFAAADGEWRVAFAFDPKRTAILLVAGDKTGGSQKRFYRQIITKADERFDAHLVRLKKERE